MSARAFGYRAPHGPAAYPAGGCCAESEGRAAALAGRNGWRCEWLGAADWGRLGNAAVPRLVEGRASSPGPVAERSIVRLPWRKAGYQLKVTYRAWEPALGPLRRTSARAGSGPDTEARTRQGCRLAGKRKQLALPFAESGPAAAASGVLRREVQSGALLRWHTSRHVGRSQFGHRHKYASLRTPPKCCGAKSPKA